MSENQAPNEPFKIAESFVKYTSRHVFLTGKAGTGKTTFLKHIVESTSKNLIVAAPTGVAAINAGGITLHSLFQLPMGPFLPESTGNSYDEITDKNALFKKLRISTEKRKLINELELLIIDEISMVRADMLDAVDAVLRYIRKTPKLPFGGIQLLMIGDLFQLPPVVPDRDWNILSRFYNSPYFFGAKALSESRLVNIELTKIYRQSDSRFIEVLNDIRNNQLSESDLDWLNQRFDPNMKSTKKDGFITLTTHNQKAAHINQNKLRTLPGKKFTFTAMIDGEFNDRSYPADEVIELKEGAQVIFTKNDKEEPRRYYNGKLGTVSKISQDSIEVTLEGSGQEISVSLEEWKNVRYELNEEVNEIEETEIGRFTQYPLKLAWAITIHKSQGLTFENAIVDAEASFNAGQVYVALSRLTSLKGLILRSKISSTSIRTDPTVVAFHQRLKNPEDLLSELENGRSDYVFTSLINCFDLNSAIGLTHDYLDVLEDGSAKFKNTAIKKAKQWLTKLMEQKVVTDKFNFQLDRLIREKELAQIRDRVEKGVLYFLDQIKEKLLAEVSKELEFYKSKRGAKKYEKSIFSLASNLTHQIFLYQRAQLIVEALVTGEESQSVIRLLEDKRSSDKDQLSKIHEAIKPRKAKRGDTQRTTLRMFKEGKSIEQIAEERELVSGTIEGHLAYFVTTGEVSVFDFVSEKKVDQIMQVIASVKAENLTSGVVKSKLGDEFSYGEIKATLNHLELEKKSG